MLCLLSTKTRDAAPRPYAVEMPDQVEQLTHSQGSIPFDPLEGKEHNGRRRRKVPLVAIPELPFHKDDSLAASVAIPLKLLIGPSVILDEQLETRFGEHRFVEPGAEISLLQLVEAITQDAERVRAETFPLRQAFAAPRTTAVEWLKSRVQPAQLAEVLPTDGSADQGPVHLIPATQHHVSSSADCRRINNLNRKRTACANVHYLPSFRGLRAQFSLTIMRAFGDAYKEIQCDRI